MSWKQLGIAWSIQAAVLFACPQLIAEANEFQEYSAYVIRHSVPIWSGPGGDYPVSSRLGIGSKVNVFREGAGGWLAIEPPEGSYSWVEDRYLEAGDDGYAECLADDAPCYVGSRFNTDRRIVHVRLRKGEVVNVLGESYVRPGAKWYKIEPPAGEFRWIKKDDVARSVPNTAAISAVGNSEAIEPENDKPSASPTSAVILQQYQEGLGKDHPRTLSTDSAEWSARTKSSTKSGSMGNIEDGLVYLTLDLSRMVAGHPDTWQVEELKKRASSLLAAAQDEDHHRLAQDLIHRIERFRKLRLKYAQIPTEWSDNPPSAARLDTYATDQRTPPNSAGVFDGQGLLTPVISRRPEAPTHALTDASGEVIYFVTPGPDVNLRRFEGRQVGILGTRGYLTDLDKRHLTARQVTPLERSTRLY